MAKKTLDNLDTLDIKAKKKKHFLVVIALISIVTVIIVSIGSAFLNVDKKKVFEERKKVEADKDMKLIQNPEFKENWAISMENRMEEQEKRARELFTELTTKQEKTLTELKQVLEEDSKKKSAEISSLNENLESKVLSLRNELMDKVQEQNNRTEQLELMIETQKAEGAPSSEDIVIGKDLLPVKAPDTSSEGNVSVNKIEDQLSKIEAFLGEEKKLTESTEKVTVKPVVEAPKKKVVQIVDIDTSYNADIIVAQSEIETNAANTAAEEEGEETNSYHISTGMSQVYMITGAYAPAFQEGDAEPLPVLFEAEGEVIVPNNHLASVEKCFLLGSAKGNMNSQTANIKLVSISCLLGDNAEYRIEGAISGWVIGENGIPGVHGELLHKNGAWLARTFVSGFLETFANAIGGGNTSNITFDSTDEDSTNNGIAIGDNLTSAGAQGISTVFNKLGEYYLKMAEQIFPVIEVKGGRTVDILLIGGEDLSIVENSNMNIANINDRLSELALKKKSNNGTIADTNAFARSVLKKNGGEVSQKEKVDTKKPLNTTKEKDYKSIYESNFGEKANKEKK